MSVNAKSNNSTKNHTAEKARELVNGEEKILKSADEELHEIGEELLEAEKIQERILRDEEKKSRLEKAKDRIEDEKKEEKDLQRSLENCKKAKSELNDLIHKIEGDKELLVFLGFAHHFDSAPSHKSMDKIEDAINNILGKNKKLGKSDLERIGKEAKDLQKELEDARSNLEEAANLIEDAAKIAKTHVYKDYDEEHDEILKKRFKILEDVAERFQKVNKDVSTDANLQEVPLDVIEQDIYWVSKIVRNAESGF